jgi:cytoskeletal protein CcmA (bactofilin family)
LLDWAPFFWGRRTHLDRRSPLALLGKPEPRTSQETGTRPSTPGATSLGAGTRFVGDLSGNEDVSLHGRLEGTISVEARVVVGPDGEVQGDVKARQVVIAGRVRGQVIGTERAELTSTAVVEGSVQAPKIVISEGARLEGKIATSASEGSPDPGVRPEEK